MNFGIIAEGHADVAVVKALVKTLKGVDGSDVVAIRPREQYDETDIESLKFSNWFLVLQSCKDEALLQSFFNLYDDALLIVHIDTAERGDAEYDVREPQRTGTGIDWAEYSEQLYENVRQHISALIPALYRDRIAYAIAIEETDAWLIPLFETSNNADTASRVNPKETLQRLIGQLREKDKKRYTGKDGLRYGEIVRLLKTKSLKQCRERNKSLDLFCLSVVQLYKQAP
jgi:hypothetical protein